MGLALRETHHLRKLQSMGIAEFIIGPAEGRIRAAQPVFRSSVSGGSPDWSAVPAFGELRRFRAGTPVS
jgi:hypothetical protein